MYPVICLKSWWMNGHYEYNLSRRPMRCDVNPKSYYGFFFKWKVCNESLVFSVEHKNWPFGKDGKLKSVIKTFSAKLLIMIVWYSCEKFSRQETLCLHLLIWRFFNFSYGRNNAMITSIIIWLSVEVQHNPQFFVLNWGDFGVELRDFGGWKGVALCVELMCWTDGVWKWGGPL